MSRLCLPGVGVPRNGDGAAQHHPLQGQFPPSAEARGDDTDSPRYPGGTPSPQHNHAQQREAVQWRGARSPDTKTGTRSRPGRPRVHAHPSVPRVPQVSGAPGTAVHRLTRAERREPGVGENHQQQRARVTLGREGRRGGPRGSCSILQNMDLYNINSFFKLKAVTQLLQSKVDLWAEAQTWLWFRCPRGRASRRNPKQERVHPADLSPRIVPVPPRSSGTGRRDLVRNCCSRCSPPRGKNGSWNFTAGQEKGHRLTEGCSPRAGGRAFLFGVEKGWEGKSHYFVWVYFGYVRT